VRILPALLAVAALALPAAARAEVPAKATWTEAYIETPGEPTLHVDVMRPKGVPEGAKVPAIVSVGPYFGHTGEGPALRFKDLIEQAKIFEKGYALVQVDLRGFGGSAGCNDFGGRGEQNDAKRAVEWTAAQPWSTGKVAMYGKSYDAWTAVMGMSEKPKGLAAAIIQSPIIDGYRTLYQNGVHYDLGTYQATTQYQALDATPPAPFDSPEYFAGAATGLNPACYASNAAQPNAWQDPDDATGYWAERALPKARGSSVPSLWSHGFNDENTRPDNFLPLYSTLTGPKRAWWGQFAHDRGNEAAKVGKPGFFEDVTRWLDFYLKGEGEDPAAEPQVEVAEGDGRWRYEAQWPPADAVTRTLAIKPGSFTDVANPGEFGSGSDTWSITAPFAAEARIAGTPVVSIDATSPSPRAHLIAQLFDVDEKGRAVLMHRAAHVIKGSPGRLSFEMFPNDWTVKAGHRLALRLTADDTRWYAPPHSGALVEGRRRHARDPLPRLPARRLPGRQDDALHARAVDAAGCARAARRGRRRLRAAAAAGRAARARRAGGGAGARRGARAREPAARERAAVEAPAGPRDRAGRRRVARAHRRLPLGQARRAAHRALAGGRGERHLQAAARGPLPLHRARAWRPVAVGCVGAAEGPLIW
jgi:hypothetical protein